MALPNFIHAGASKCGTTTLYSRLKRHPDVYLPETNEVCFFDKDDDYVKGLPFYEYRYFSESPPRKIVGDMSSTYLFEKPVPERIKKNLGTDIKIGLNFRHPVKRAVSAYKMAVRQFRESLSFEVAIKREKEILSKLRRSNGYNYISGGFYATHLANFLKFFDKQRFFFFIMEEDIDCEEHWRRFLQFLEISDNCHLLDNPGAANESPRLVFEKAGGNLKSELWKSALIRKGLGKKISGIRQWYQKKQRWIPDINENSIIIRNQGQITSVLLDPSVALKEYISKVDRLLSWQPSRDYEAFLFHSHFKTETKRLEEMLGRDLSNWYKHY